jgi:hypothetical protein
MMRMFCTPGLVNVTVWLMVVPFLAVFTTFLPMKIFMLAGAEPWR